MIIANKPSNVSNIESINNHAKNYKRNYKQCQKLIEKASDELNITFKNETTPLLIENREAHSQLREEILNWFFSLPLETRFKIITIENSWIINIIYHMYVYYKHDNTSSFEFLQKETDKADSESPNNSFYFINNSYSNDNSGDKEEFNLLSQFTVKSIKRDKHDYYLFTMFLKETRFFSVHSNIDCMSLSPKVLDDRDLFVHYFKNFSKEKCFTKIIDVIQDPKTKSYCFAFPKWIEKDSHQIASYIVAFLEQSIVIKFILNYNNKNKEKLITSLHDEVGFNEFFKLRKEIIFFLNENYPNNKIHQSGQVCVTNNNNSYNMYSNNNFQGTFSNIIPKNETVEKFIKNINIKKIYSNVHSKNTIEKIRQKNPKVDKNYNELLNRKLNTQEPLFEGVNEEDTEKKICKLYSNEEIVIFVDNLIFAKIDSIWQLDFYIGVELLQSIHNLYTDKNALDLIKEFEEGNDDNKNKKGKNKKSKTPEFTSKDYEKMNFNYYKPYLNKDNLQNISKNINENNNKYINSLNNYNTFNNCFENSNNNQINNNILNIVKKDNKNKDFYNNGEKIEIKSIEENKLKYKNEKLEIVHEEEVNIICSEIIENIIDDAVSRGQTKLIKPINTIVDFIDNFNTINLKSKEINNLLVNKKMTSHKINSKDNLMIECAYDIELGMKTNYKCELEKEIGHTTSIYNNKNNFIIENHQISIENTRMTKMSCSKILDEIENSNYENNEIENEYFKEKEDNSENEENPNKKNTNSKIQTSVDNSDSDFDNNLSKKENFISTQENQDDDSENNLNSKDKKKKNKKKVQKFYQINIEKLNKKKNNNNNNKNENKGNSLTINKSTQTSKEINGVNLNLNINNQNLINNINKKYDKKGTIGKNTYSNTTNVNINNNVNFNNIKSTTNNININKNLIQSREYSKYDFPKNNKKNSFHKSSNYDQNSESPLTEKIYNPKMNANLNSYNTNPKDFQNIHRYSFNKGNQNNYNINFNYDLNYENQNQTNPNYPHLSNNGNARKKSNNWIEPKISLSTGNFYDYTKSAISNNQNHNSINSFIFSKPNNNNEFLAYVFKLHYDILNYHNNVVEIVNSIKDIKVNVISYIEKILKEFIEYEISLDVFGSFASDLSIESSDIDLKVNILNQDSIMIDYEELIFNLVKKFNSLNIFEFVMPIHTASVPIIKLIVDPTKIIDDDNHLKYEEFKFSEAYYSFKFNKEDLNKFRIDLTFLDLIKKQHTNSLGSIDFAKNHIILYAEIKPILFILKRLLQERNLNSAFNGGLSSYCIFLLILAFIKYQKASNFNLNSNLNTSNCNNLGKLLIDFLEHYGRMFNFHIFTVDVNQSNPFIFDSKFYEKCPMILDPLNYHNVSKSSFRIDEVKECFSKSYDYLIQIKYKYDRKDSDNNRNIIYDLILNKNN